MADQKILIIDSESLTPDLLATSLQNFGYQTVMARDGGSGLTKALTESPSLILLDVDLPIISGLEVCKQLKTVIATRHIPVLMMSVNSGEQERIHGLELGAEDFIQKPYNIREVVLRIQRSLGRIKLPDPIREKLVVGPFVLDPVRHELRIKRKLVDLTAVEFKLLALLLKHRGSVLDRRTLLLEVWGFGNAIYMRTVDTHIQRIRSKLGEEAAASIETVRGVGYRIKDDSISPDDDVVPIEVESEKLIAA